MSRSASRCFNRLEAADRPAELHAVLRVLDRPFEQRFARAHHFGGLHERRELQRPAISGSAVPGAATTSSWETVTASNATSDQRRVRSMARHDSRADAVGGPRNQHEPAAGLRPDSDEQHVGCRRAGNEPGDAGE